MNEKKALVAMSGGVDSSVCAYLVKELGYIPHGITMKLWSESEEIHNCDNPLFDRNCIDASNAAKRLGISHSAVALGDSFKKNVVDKFISDYVNGYTPNPCVECNKHIKFGELIELADRLGYDFLATGHYARIEKDIDGQYVLKKAIDAAKDQSYFLWSIKKEYLSKILFPLGAYTKKKIREIATDLKLESAHRSDSQDICFIPNGDYVSFIKAHTNKEFEKGNFISPDGKILGTHSGIINYTIGQRKGLGIALGEPAFVCKKSVAENTVTLCRDSDLYSDTLVAHSLNFLIDTPIDTTKFYDIKIRYRHTPAPAKLEFTDDNKLAVKFKIPQRAITAGQSVVFYDGDILVGGGIIE